MQSIFLSADNAVTPNLVVMESINHFTLLYLYLQGAMLNC